MKSKYIEGKEACWDGRSEEDNPYIPHGYKGSEMPNEDAEEWHRGYCEAREGDEDDGDLP